MSLSETRALEILHRALGGPGDGRKGVRSKRMPLGIGDDAAVLEPEGERIVWTTDACNEGAHFRDGWLQPEELAHKAFHSAASDVAAMGATLRFVNCQLTLTPAVTASFLRRFAEEQAHLCRQHRAVVCGGNVTMGGELSVVTSVLGGLPREAGTGLRRDAARPGDEIWLVGQVGLAHLGFRLLERGGRTPRGAAFRACLDAFRRPEAQLVRGPRLLGRARAALDLSDGLLRDAGHLAQASAVTLRFDLARLERALRPELLRAAEELGWDARAVAIVGGEDYALLCTGPPALRPRWAPKLGEVVAATQPRGSVVFGCGTSEQAKSLARALLALEPRALVKRDDVDLHLSGGYQHGAIKKKK